MTSSSARVSGANADPSAGSSLAHLRARLSVIEAAVSRAVAARRATDPAPDDPFRGLYLTDEHVDALLVRGPAQATARAPEGTDDDAPERARNDGPDLTTLRTEVEARVTTTTRLRTLAAAFGLDPLDVEILLIALAPDLDPRFERLYGYLNDDVTRRRATVGLALELAGASPVAASDRGRFGATAALVSAGLVVLEDLDRPMLGRGLRVPDRVTAHLLGDDAPAAELLGVLAEIAPLVGDGFILEDSPLIYLRDSVPGYALSAASTGLKPNPVTIDTERIDLTGDLDQLARVAGREARLRGSVLVVGPVEILAAKNAATVRAFADLPCPVRLAGSTHWDPSWATDVPLVVEPEPSTVEEHAQVWREYLDGSLGAELTPPALAAVVAPYRFAPTAVRQAARSAQLAARADGAAVTAHHIRVGARSRNAAGLERLANRITPGVGWDDLILPAAVSGLLRELSARVRHRDTVLGSWRMRPGGGRGRGVSALFAGDSGTGKTMAAEVLAGDLGLDLYVIDLSTVIDKYVGETEKNLERIFTEAAHVNGVLLFDEADAVFGKRSEVSDAHDRYANVETAYLLQRMESFDGIAILTTNLRANVDEAFLRRLDVIADFPKPDEAARRRLWETCLMARGNADSAPYLALGKDLDLDFCARAFELSGGNIRSIAVTAAYLAASRGGPLGMSELVTAIHREYRKLGRLALANEFGEWLSAVQ